LNARGNPILVIDGYAGPGVFDDGREGSPMIICQAAERYARGKYQAIFINKDQEHHEKLLYVLHKEGRLNSVKAVLGDTIQELPRISNRLRNQSVLLYLDPFGPTGCDFSLLQPFLTRNPDYSTEILLTLNMPGMHRLATGNAVKAGRRDEQLIRSYHQKLTSVFGGEYWQEIMWNEYLTPKEREFQLVEAYRLRLAEYLPFTGFCPVQEQTDKRIKYFIVFASRHPHTVTLLNDMMLRAYYEGMHEAEYPEGSIWSWEDLRVVKGLETAIVEVVALNQGKTREVIWLEVVQKHFMEYQQKEYRAEVQRLIDERKLVSPTPRKKKLLNDNCTLFLPDKTTSYANVSMEF
jgi:three-Cys-motif partner protein